MTRLLARAASFLSLWASVLKELILGLDSDPLGTSHSHLQKKEMLTVHVIVLSFSLFCGIIHGQSLRKPISVGNRPVHRSMHPHATWDMKAALGLSTGNAILRLQCDSLSYFSMLTFAVERATFHVNSH